MLERRVPARRRVEDDVVRPAGIGVSISWRRNPREVTWSGKVCCERGGRLIVEQISDLQGNVGNGSVPPLAFDTREHASYQYKNVKVDAFAALWLIS